MPSSHSQAVLAGDLEQFYIKYKVHHLQVNTSNTIVKLQYNYISARIKRKPTKNSTRKSKKINKYLDLLFPADVASA